MIHLVRWGEVSFVTRDTRVTVGRGVSTVRQWSERAVRFSHALAWACPLLAQEVSSTRSHGTSLKVVGT